MTTGTPTRPMLRYHGGKWVLAPWIISHFPPHRVYVEPFAGAASVLLRKPRAYAEIINDLNGEVVNVWRVCRDRGAELAEKLRLTAFAREEYEVSFEAARDDPLERARRTVVRSFMGFGSNAICRRVKSGFRANSHRSGTTPAHDWANFPDALAAITERLRGVVIERRPALKLIEVFDSPRTLFYCDPPYPHSTRSNKMHGCHGYDHEMTDDDHAELALALTALKGMVVLSGYESDLYRKLYGGWRTVRKETYADGARPRVEMLWISPNTPRRAGLFDEVATHDPT